MAVMRKPIAWITVNGNHVPIFEEGKTVADHNEDVKETQIEQNKNQADTLNNKKALEQKILDALEQKMDDMAKYDADRKAEYDDYMAQAKMQTSEYWKKDLENTAQWALSWQHHGYEFVEEWKNILSKIMYNKIYHEWHPAQAGKYKGGGHAGYSTSELTPDERSKITKIYKGLVKQGYLKESKSGYKATFVKPKKN